MNEYLLDFWQDFSRPENIIGHLAYILLITSMMMRNINWLRALAILSGSISAFYYWTLDDKVSMTWEFLFTLVNIFQLLILQLENRRGSFSEDENYFIQTCLPSVERAHARRLVKLGAWTQVEEDQILMAEDTKPDQMKFLVSGTASVSHSGRKIGTVHKGDFLGEMSYLTGKMASATVTTNETVRYLAFDQTRLREHLSRNIEVRHALEVSFNRNLAEKLVKSNENERENSSANRV